MHSAQQPQLVLSGAFPGAAADFGDAGWFLHHGVQVLARLLQAVPEGRGLRVAQDRKHQAGQLREVQPEHVCSSVGMSSVSFAFANDGEIIALE